MGRKPANYPNPNIYNVRIKNKWRIGDCQTCGKTGIRSKDWNLHAAHESSQAEKTAKTHKKLVQGISSRLHQFLEGSFYNGLQMTFPNGIPEEGQKEIEERV
jgi:hypothetical protein